MGNWKMNGSSALVDKFNESEFKTLHERDIVIAPPFTLLYKNIPHGILKGAQNVYYKEQGAHTGEVSATLLKELGVSHVIIGHSERRSLGELYYFDRVNIALKHGLNVVFCVGETLEERESSLTMKVINGQLKDIENIPYTKDNLIVAYEPVWAIGTGKAATPEQAEEVHRCIKQTVKHGVRVIYGGSVTPDNAQDLAHQQSIDGFLVGGASLDPVKFAQICDVSFQQC
jgi:triosephosphate isomerase